MPEQGWFVSGIMKLPGDISCERLGGSDGWKHPEHSSHLQELCADYSNPPTKKTVSEISGQRGFCISAWNQISGWSFQTVQCTTWTQICMKPHWCLGASRQTTQANSVSNLLGFKPLPQGLTKTLTLGPIISIPTKTDIWALVSPVRKTLPRTCLGGWNIATNCCNWWFELVIWYPGKTRQSSPRWDPRIPNQW